jgi:glycosyltransferase involved in cell wall biosynthesis
MDRDLSPRIAYWTSAFESEMEAVASEVALLRRTFPRSVAWGVSPNHWARLRWREGCVHPRLHLLFRATTKVLERAFQINHIFGSLGDWFYLQGSRRRPTILTVAAHSTPLASESLDRVDRFVTEHPGGRDELARLGYNGSRVRLILPPVDLQRFTPRPAPQAPFTVLFASSPADEAWLEGRGVRLLLELAALQPRTHFRLLWRPWGNALPIVRKWIQERDLKNVELDVGRQDDMAQQYAQAHMCIAPFTDPHWIKPAPNSVIESMACGRPVLVTPIVGLAEMIQEARAGAVCAATAEALSEQLDRVRVDWESYASAARSLAERWFGADRFLDEYRRLYAEVLNGNGKA